MKSPFTALPEKLVTLSREVEGGEPLTFELVLRPWPIGFPEMLDRVFPVPVLFEMGKPVPDRARDAEHTAQRSLILLARCMGAQLDAKPPAEGADRKAWAAYADAIRAEFEAAAFVEGDVSQLLAEASRLNRGAGRIPKA